MMSYDKDNKLWWTLVMLLSFAFGFLVLSLPLAYLLMMLWSLTIVPFGAIALSFWQAWGLLLLLSWVGNLFKGKS